MARKGFDLAALAKEAMGDDTRRTNLDTMMTVEAGLIMTNDANFYEMSDLEALAASIELVGLLQPILVQPDGGDGGYILIDGERRFRAMTDVLGRKEIPCIVRRPANDVIEELMLIEANRQQRKMTAAELSKQAERYTELLAALRESGVDIPGRLRDAVAEALQVSSSKLGRLSAIRKNLEPGLLAMFDNGEINESVAYELSKFDHQKQLRVIDMYPGWEPNALHADMIRLASGVDDKSRAAEAQQKPPEPGKSAAPKLSVDPTASQKPMDAYRRRTSIRDAARLLDLDPEKSIQENIENLERQCRCYHGSGGPGYEVSCKPGKIILDECTRCERRYTLRAFIELAAEMWIEEAIQPVVATSKPRLPALDDIWYDTEDGDFPDEDIDVADLIAWGDAGLKTVPGDSFQRAYASFPDRYRWWAIVAGPEEDADEA